jgi:hypothetical protein
MIDFWIVIKVVAIAFFYFSCFMTGWYSSVLYRQRKQSKRLEAILSEKSKKGMSDYEKNWQRLNFTYGNTRLSDESITHKDIEDADEHMD